MLEHHGPQAAQAAMRALVPITPVWRTILLVYILGWQVVAPIVSILIHGSDDPHPVLRAVVRIASGLLAIAPLLAPRFGGLPVGWLHPLVLPPLVQDAMEFIKTPLMLFAPLLVWWQPLPLFTPNQMLVGWGREGIYQVMLKAESLTLLAQVSLYLGFLLIRWRPYRLGFFAPRRVAPRMIAILGILCAAFLVFLQLRGGLTAHIASFGMGRHVALGELGHVVGIFRAAPVMLVVWYALDRGAVRNPVFYVFVAIICAMQFAASGSRSGVILPIVAVAVVHLWHTHRLPIVPAILVGLVAPIVIGSLWAVRASTWGSSTVDFSSITQFDLRQSLETSSTNIGDRQYNSPYLPTIAKVPREANLLWGSSYVGAALFFIPRALWPEKPRAIGAYAMSEIMEVGRGLDGPYEGAAASPGAVAEAYWNFHLFGIIGVFLLFGAFQSWLVRSFVANADNPAAVPLYVTTILNFFQPSTSQFAPWIQLIVMVLLTYMLLGMFGLKRRAFLLQRV